AIDALKHVEYDLLILDNHMGAVSGLNVMQWIHEQKLQLPVIVLTGAGSDTLAVEMMKLGAFDYRRKDQVEISRFPAFVRATLEAFQSRLERRATQSSHGRVSQNNVVSLLENTSASFSRSAEAVLGLIADEFDEYHKRVRPNLNPSVQSDVDRIMRNFQEQLKLVSLFTRTLADLTSISKAQQTPTLQSSPRDNRFGEGSIRTETPDLDTP
ncbi:MAG TPA: response regulator, partial [Terriglobia bacterium]|nr:response regulator [Terriglobia bacterium]